MRVDCAPKLRTTLAYIMANYDRWTHEALEYGPHPPPPHYYQYVQIPRPVFTLLKTAYEASCKSWKLQRSQLDA